jgi:hypothetical protein
MALTLMEILKEITYHKSDLNFDDPEVFKAYDIFIINKFLSSIEYLLPFVDMINKPGVDKRDHYLYFKSIIPKSTYPLRFIKREVDDTQNENIKYLCQYLEIGQREAKEYLQFLSPEQIEKLRSIYRYGQNGKKNSIDELL